MTKHMPECPSGQRKWQRAEAPMYGALCICRELRDCEQRVEEAMDRAWEQAVRIAEAHARVSTLTAAREAVADADPYWKVETSEGESVFVMEVNTALAAIDALRAGDHSVPRQPEGYSPTATDNRP